MRFDDMIATVLDRASDRPEQRRAQWRQLVDLLAQRHHGDSDVTIGAYAFLRRHRTEIDLTAREGAARTLRGLRIAPDLVRFFGEDHPSVAAALLRGVQLDADEWIGLLPALTPTGRAVLRHRRDLPAAVDQALAGFGASDFVIEDSRPADRTEAVKASTVAEVALPKRVVQVPGGPVAEGRSQISQLVERIETFQRLRDREDQQPTASVRADAFRWETGPEGLMLWIEGAPRGSLVGQSIASIAALGQHGVDGQAAGAFHKRAPFRDARFSVAGDGAAAGDWRISAVPFFDPHRGHFLGFRGSARRPRIDEVAGPARGDAAPAGLFGTQFEPDALRQLIHELRTPLNAIIGFAEMIEGQYLGPAGLSYRGRANEIVGQAQRLLSAVDDLDVAARVDPADAAGASEGCDVAALLVRLHDGYEAETGRVRFHVETERALPRAAVEAAAAERMLARLLAAAIGLAGASEVIGARVVGDRHGGRTVLRLAIDRPRAIAGLEEEALLHPGYSPDGDWPAAPALGLGFALRLVRKLAEASGGSLEVGEDRFFLVLPAHDRDAATMARSDGESG